jgi:hypothetical protein
MATKVYWKALEMLLRRVNRYIGKWSAELSDNLDDDQMTAVNLVFTSNQAALALLPSDTPVD